MNKRMLGKTGLEVSEVALGGLFISEAGGEFEQGKAATLRALELGINYIDTAPGYLNSEEVLGKVLEDVDKPLVLSTKLGGRPVPFEPQNKEALRRSVEESLRLLKRDYIDILMIHEADRPGQYAWWTDRASAEGPVWDLLEELKEEGIIGFTGIAGTTAYEMAHLIRTGKFDVVLTAFNYSLLFREAEQEIIPEAVKQEMGIVVGSPLQQGRLARRIDQKDLDNARWLSKARYEQFRCLYEVVEESGMSLPELGLRFVISNPAVSCVLTGARSSQEVEASCAFVEKGPLPEELAGRLDEIAAMVPFRPSEEPFSLPFGYDFNWPGGLQ